MIVTIDPSTTHIGYTFGGFPHATKVPSALSAADMIRMLPRGSEAIGIASLGTCMDEGVPRRVKVITVMSTTGMKGTVTFLDTGIQTDLDEPPEGHLADVITDQLIY